MSSEQNPAASSDSRLPTFPAQAMGDVLAKEHADYSTDHIVQVQAETAPSQPAQPPLITTGPSPVKLLAGLTPLDDDDSRPESPATQSSETKEDRLSTEVVLNEQNSIENGEDSATSDNDDQCQTASTTTDDLCNCEDCNWRKKDLSSEDLQEMMKLRRLGMDLRQYIRYSFNWYLENPGFANHLPVPLIPQELESSNAIKSFTELQESVALLCDRIPCHLFMWLVGQAQEFVIGVKVQLLTLLYDRSIDNLAEVFLTKLLDGYDALLSTAVHITDLLEPLQKELLNKVDLSWEQINKRLYQNYVYSDPLIQNNLPPFIGQLRKHLSIKSSEYHDLVHRYLGFDDEITKIGPLSPEIERLIDKYNAEQVTGSVMKKVREDFERFKTRLKHDESSSTTDFTNKSFIAKEEEEEDEEEEEKEEDSVKTGVIEEVLDNNSDFQSCSLPNAIEIQSMFNDWKKSPQQRLADLVEALTLSTADEDKSNIMKEGKCYSASGEKIAKDNINQSVSCEKESCNCNSIVGSIVKHEVTPSLVNNSAKEDINESNNGKDPTSIPPNLEKQNTDCCTEPVKKITITAQSTQIQTRHSTTQTTSINHSQNNLHRHHHQGRCSSHTHLHGNLTNGVIKSFGPQRTHVAHNNHPSAAVTCHKQQHIVEHIKRLSTNDLSPRENGDYSDSASSHDDCSATNSPTPRDSNRHCDCCYCEVFGHGVPSVAPVSRNYNEMRERLRQLLSKKKAKVCVSSCNTRPKNSAEVSSSSPSLSSSSSTSSTTTNIDATTLPNPASKSLPPIAKNSNAFAITAAKVSNATATAVPTVVLKPKEEKWDLEAAVEFIEGNQSGKKNTKKAEKKARQKQKKLEEKLKKDKEEEERLKLIELQKKTPEVTITVVNPQKQGSQKAMSQQKLPEVSILPAKSTPQFALSSKLANSAKKKNNEVVSNTNNKNASKTKTTPVVAASEGAKKKTASVDKNNEVSNTINTKSKTTGKIQTNEVITPPLVDFSNLTKKERKKLRREMEKQEALKKELDGKQSGNSSEQLQIVTIKRIMESINSEPTVTITLKGQTPAEDRVLFTLVNGQTKDSSGDKQQQSTGKKKKNKANSSASQQQVQTANKSQQPTSSTNNVKSEIVQKTNSKVANCQQTNKSKTGKQQEEPKPRQQPTLTAAEVKATNAKSKKDKKKNNNENKENIKQLVNESSQKQETNSVNKKSNKAGTAQTVAKQQQQIQQNSNSNNKNAKVTKSQSQSQNQTQAQSQNQKKNVNTNQINSSKTSNNQQSGTSSKSDNQKTQKVSQNTVNKQKQIAEVAQIQRKEPIDPSINRKLNNAPATISIENLKLPPGITITKVDAPAKPISIKTNSAPKPASSVPKQTTIIAAPMSGIQATGYGNPQGTGNVIVVDTGRLKQDLMPKNADKDANNQSMTSKKKKKKKKSAITSNGTDKVSSPAPGMRNVYANDYPSIEPARILHNPSTNMVTIRNPAFGPPPSKMESCPNQAAIIKVGDNGMVTIRSPALQQAINMGLTPSPKPDFVVKGSANSHESSKPIHNNYMSSSELSGTMRGSNGIPVSTDLAELRRRLAQPPENDRNSSTLCNNGLSSIQISKVTNGQSPNIPENGINLKGTSVTLTKIRNSEIPLNQQQLFDETKGNAMNGSVTTKSRKKKKRGNGVRQGGDDWNLVESVFTPKDIDLEDGEMDDAERELEAFKRFCLQSVPPPRKEKVNLNLKDIVLKKKSSAGQANAPVLAAI
ncbi:mucin-4 [Phymastichus coffea]|uniref:mucin-4 n=1 Tax=Phymastichus coffea TaxID=108790 RepID=UPI00273B4F00|nr:mucin-4 [Phymastichus coffea]